MFYVLIDGSFGSPFSWDAAGSGVTVDGFSGLDLSVVRAMGGICTGTTGC